MFKGGLGRSAKMRAPKTCLQERRNISQKRQKRERRKNEGAEKISFIFYILLPKILST